MTIDQQVCSLELAQKLKTLGVKQESLFHWSNRAMDDVKTNWCVQTTLDKCFKNVAAFTVAELGEMLGRATVGALIKAYGHVFNVPDTRFITETGLQACMSRPDIGAKMLIYLLENKIITV